MTDTMTPEILGFAKGMCQPGGSIGTFVMSDLLKNVVGHAQEMSMPVVDAIAERLVRDGHRSEGDALILDGVALFSPDTGSAWHAALAISAPARNGLGQFRTLTLLEYVGKPDPVIDSIVENALRKIRERAEAGIDPVPSKDGGPGHDPVSEDDGHNSSEGMEEDVEESRIREMRTDVVEDGFDSTLARMMADERSWQALASTTSSYPSSFGGWSIGNRGSGYDDGWDVHYDVLNKVVVAAGMSSLLADVVAEYRSRTWNSHLDGHDGLETYLASYRAAVHIVGTGPDSLPARDARAAVTAIQSYAMARDLESMAGMLIGIADLAERNGHVGVGVEFVYDDLDRDVALFGSGEGFRSVYFLDQNVAHVVRIHGDGERIALFSHRRSNDWNDIPEDDRYPAILRGAADGSSPESDALAVFERRADGYGLVSGFGGDIDSVKSWNGFVVNVEYAHSTLSEEYGVAAIVP